MRPLSLLGIIVCGFSAKTSAEWIGFAVATVRCSFRPPRGRRAGGAANVFALALTRTEDASVTVVFIGGSRRVTRLADEATVGLMLWDGTSRGTLANVERLVERGKPVLVYTAPRREFAAVRGPDDLAALRRRVGAPDDGSRGAAAGEDQAALF